MPGDGVSMPTIISQLGNVAKTQAQNQKAAGGAAGALTNHDKEELQALRKVQEPPKAGKQSLQTERDARRGRDSGRQDQDDQEQEAAAGLPEDEDGSPEDRGPGLGLLIDRKA